MEMFGCSIRELTQRFTKSELILLAWRSREQAAAFEKRISGSRRRRGRQEEDGGSEKRRYDSGSVPEGLPNKFYNEQGELDLRQVTGSEAFAFFQAQGIKLPIIHRRS